MLVFVPTEVKSIGEAILFTSVGARYFWTSLWIHLNKKYSILQEDKSTPLHFACAQGGLEMIENQEITTL
jgi:hypothetical protein